jgi:uncharacterized membrane protein
VELAQVLALDQVALVLVAELAVLALAPALDLEPVVQALALVVVNKL